jgi:hypothetical protein
MVSAPVKIAQRLDGLKDLSTGRGGDRGICFSLGPAKWLSDARRS